MANISALPPPLGVQPNFQDPESRGYQIIVTGAVTLALSLFFVSGKIYSKVRISGLSTWGWEDSVCVLALFSVIGYVALCIYSLSLGLGIHLWDMSISAFDARFLKVILCVQVLGGPVIFVIKLALFLLYFRVFAPARWFKYLICIGIAFNFLFYATCTIVQSIYCSPALGSTWAQFIMAQLMDTNRCDKMITLSIVQSSVSIASDTYMLILPIPAVWQLRMRIRKKLAVLSVFMTGMLAFLASILSLYFRSRMSIYGDLTWELVPPLITLIVEMNVGIICCCMPSFATLLRHHLDSPTDSRWNGSTAVASQRSGRLVISKPIPLEDDIETMYEGLEKWPMTPVTSPGIPQKKEIGSPVKTQNVVSSRGISPTREDKPSDSRSNEPRSLQSPIPNWREAHYRPTRSSTVSIQPVGFSERSSRDAGTLHRIASEDQLLSSSNVHEHAAGWPLK